MNLPVAINQIHMPPCIGQCIINHQTFSQTFTATAATERCRCIFHNLLPGLQLDKNDGCHYGSSNYLPFRITRVQRTTPIFSGVRITRSLVLFVICKYVVDHCLSFRCFGYCIVCSSSICIFGLPLSYLQKLLSERWYSSFI